MSIPGVPDVPPVQCDFCNAEPAIASIMNLADYQTQKFGAGCGPEFLRSLAAAMAGEDIPAAAGPAIDITTGQPERSGEPVTEQCPLCGQRVALADIPGHAQTHLAEGEPEAGIPAVALPPAPDPLTANVVKSTHGNRKPRGKAATDDE